MSLILEALNKAEHERSGELTQSTSATYSLSVDDKNWWGTLSFIFVVMGIAAIALYLSMTFFQPQPEAPAITTQSTKTKAETDQQETEPSSTAPAPESAAPIVSVSTKEAPAHTHNSIKNDNAMRLQAIASTPQINHIPAETADIYSKAATTTPEQHELQTSQPRIKSTQTVNPDISTSLDTSVFQTADEASIGDKYLDAPIFQNLPSAIKSQLPDLELNIHVYSTIPAKSFVYINSKRYREGATIGNGITLERVIPTGVVLRHQETIFRLIIET